MLKLSFVALLPIHCLHLNVGSTGLLFPYTLGALAYIKTNINPPNCHLTGTSGGSWCSILYHFENKIDDHDLLWKTLIGDESRVIRLLDRCSMETHQKQVALNIYKKYQHRDVSDIPLSIIVTKISNGLLENIKVDKFANLEEVITYSLCSSYIPYISGKKGCIDYNGTKYMDGAMTVNRNLLGHELHIDKSTWNRKFLLKDRFVLNFESSKRLYNDGWNDAKLNLKYLKRSGKDI